VVSFSFFFYIFLRGAGSWSIDGMIGKEKSAATTTAT
jgi:hypothetical protein